MSRLEIFLPENTIATEDGKDIRIGRDVFPVVPFSSWIPNPTVINFINVLNRPTEQAKQLRRSLTRGLCDNSRNDREEIAHTRAVSAYFTYNPENETLIIEWGTIDPKTGEAKLHYYLNQTIDYNKRVRNQRMKLSSGHIAETLDGTICLALLDNLHPETEASKDSPMGKIINTLYAHDFVPITGEGFVRFPAF